MLTRQNLLELRLIPERKLSRIMKDVLTHAINSPDWTSRNDDLSIARYCFRILTEGKHSRKKDYIKSWYRTIKRTPSYQSAKR